MGNFSHFFPRGKSESLDILNVFIPFEAIRPPQSSAKLASIMAFSCNTISCKHSSTNAEFPILSPKNEAFWPKGNGGKGLGLVEVDPENCIYTFSCLTGAPMAPMAPISKLILASFSSCMDVAFVFCDFREIESVSEESSRKSSSFISFWSPSSRSNVYRVILEDLCIFVFLHLWINPLAFLEYGFCRVFYLSFFCFVLSQKYG